MRGGGMCSGSQLHASEAYTSTTDLSYPRLVRSAWPAGQPIEAARMPAEAATRRPDGRQQRLGREFGSIRRTTWRESSRDFRSAQSIPNLSLFATLEPQPSSANAVIMLITFARTRKTHA